MSAAARSVFAFGLYLAAGGILLLLAPGLVCRVLLMNTPVETIWMRLCGMFFLDLAFYCVMASRNENLVFMRWSIYTRPWTLAFLSAFAALGMVKPILLVFGVVDVAASAWTFLALREGRLYPYTAGE